MRLTTRGRSCLILAVGMFITARVLGIAQLWVVGSATVLVVLLAVGWIAVVDPDLTAHRVVAEKFQVGKLGHVVLAISNNARRTTPTLTVTDLFDAGARSAPFLVSPLGTDELARAAYKVPTERRGLFELGPLIARCSDPFGIATRQTMLADSQKVLVHPRVHEITVVPELGGDSLDTHSAELRGRPDVGGEFHLLRDYDPTDDLRRVHWKTSARRDRLVVRQDESKRRSPVVVLLDERASHHSVESFELAIEVVASVATSLERSNRPYIVMSIASGEIGHGGQRHLASVLDSLAVMQLVSTDRHPHDPSPGGRSGTLIVVTGFVNKRDRVVFDLDRRSHSGVATVLTNAGAIDDGNLFPTAGKRPRLVIRIGDRDSLVETWNSSVLDWNQKWSRTVHATTRN